MEGGEAPVDLSRLTKPEAEAFRYIADALGARFAGDGPPEPETGAQHTQATAPDALPAPARRGSTLDAALCDPRAATLLDRIPLATIVAVGDTVTFMNRTALSQLGYGSASVLDAAGGLGAVIDGSAPERSGAMTVNTATGARFTARVTMATVTWAARRAMLVVIEPCPRTAANRPAPGDMDALTAFLDANPDPVAIVAPDGTVEACNGAFRRLAPNDHAAVRLADRLGAEDLRHVTDLIAVAPALSDGPARVERTVSIAGTTYTVSVGAIGDGALACLVFHAETHALPDARARGTPGPDALAPPSPGDGDRAQDGPSDGESALAAAVREVRGLVSDTAVLVLTEGDGTGRTDPAERRMLRLLLLAVAARAPTGSVLTVRCEEAGYTLDLSGGRTEPVAAALGSPRLTELAGAAGFDLRLDGTGRLWARRRGAEAHTAGGGEIAHLDGRR